MKNKETDPMNETMDKSIKQNKPVHVVVLHNEGCPSTPKTIELIETCVAEKGIEINSKKILVKNQIEANELRFLGSPTIQVNGIDIDPSARDANVFGFMWRTYGTSVVPPKEMIISALMEALKKAG